ncbi:hypothetical protein M438DRAFT_340842 [Aureobasidium pullulans EXF-150]|uniref:Retrotransposon gag domain-containing protein n=1 Tax=Aureobasidium pullulans EXF-150 TaxID=1043002 RepID=A0A074WYP0_AURPU|nr:uncharacterized protein M438DRAFT_340842 [Aureobasidium pullulans EXF-150]KEQ78303.1 hypothetical protein M438DRAFT_340842 [Aureobasidium pullulans EXF-150]
MSSPHLNDLLSGLYLSDDDLAARLEALKRRSSLPRARALPQPPRQIKTSPVSPRARALALPQPPRQERSPRPLTTMNNDCSVARRRALSSSPVRMTNPPEFDNDKYGERHRESRAWSELSRLHQGEDTFADFFAHFEELLAYVTLLESVQINFVLDKLSFRYADKVEDGTSYDSLR